jgi:hypothetical protein
VKNETALKKKKKKKNPTNPQKPKALKHLIIPKGIITQM